MSSGKTEGRQNPWPRFGFRFTTLFGLVLLLIVSCTSKNENPKEVNLAIWGNYLSKAAQDRFTQETGLKLNVLNYSSNEELLAKVQAGGSGLDVAVPSDYMVDVMIKLALLEPIERSKIPAASHILPNVLAQPFDPENKFSLPYAWATTGIAVNRDLFKDPITSWKDFLENPKLAGKIALLDDVREVISAVLKMRGQSANTTDPEVLGKAKEDLLRIRKNVKMFTSDSIDILKNQEVVAAQAYSPDALQAVASSTHHIEFILPSEGGTRSIDNLVILKGTRNPEGARKLIDFLLRKENNVEFVKATRSGPVIQGVREALPADIKGNPSLFPSEAVLSKLERIHDLGEKNRAYEEIWTAVKTGP